MLFLFVVFCANNVFQLNYVICIILFTFLVLQQSCLGKFALQFNFFATLEIIALYLINELTNDHKTYREEAKGQGQSPWVYESKRSLVS